MEFPVLTKEMRSRTRGWKRWLHHGVVAAPFVFFVLQVCLAWDRGEAPVGTLVLAECLVMLLLVPAFAGGTIARECEQHTIESLLFTPLSSWQIVLGKWLSALMSVSLMIAGVLPLAGVWGFLDQSILPLLAAQGIILLAAGFVAAFSLYISTFFRKLTNATATAYSFAFSFLLFPTQRVYISWMSLDMSSVAIGLGYAGCAMAISTAVMWLMSVVVRFFTRRMPSPSFLIAILVLLSMLSLVMMWGLPLLYIYKFPLPPFWIMGNPFGTLACVLENSIGYDNFTICYDLNLTTLLLGLAGQFLLIPMLLHLTAMRIDGMRENQRVEGLVR